MRIVKFEMLNSELYSGFSQGSATDQDVIARACGVLQGHEVVSLKSELKDEDGSKYFLDVSFESCGEQRLEYMGASLRRELSTKLKRSLSEIEDVLLNARDNKIESSKEVALLSEIIEEEDQLFIMNSWYEGFVTLKKEDHETKEVTTIISGVPVGDFCHDGVYGSVQDIHGRFGPKEAIDIVEYQINT